MIKEFKEFIMQGNVLDLAVGVVIGGAFTAIVSAIVEGLITPLVVLVTSLIPGVSGGDIENMTFYISNVAFNYGSVLNAIITFIITAFVIFMIVKSANKFKKKEEEAEPEVEVTEALLIEIRDLLAQDKNKATF